MKVSKRKKKTENVIMVTKGSVGTLKIDDHEVTANSIKQTIVWKLDSSLNLGDFSSFTWVDPNAVPGTFDAPEITPDGNWLTVGDHNGPTAKKGNLAYIITVEMGGVLYTSRTNTSALMVKDPVIINR